jgi:hypothetical protein
VFRAGETCGVGIVEVDEPVALAFLVSEPVTGVGGAAAARPSVPLRMAGMGGVLMGHGQGPAS